MAAAARPPGIGDARVPCAFCGGLIHPVAGRCKHCKEDLTQFRAGRPQAAAQLPALNGHAVAPAQPASSGNGAAHAVSAYAPAAAPIAIPTAREGSQPILPPRPTGRSMSAARPRGSLLRNWPMIVIVLAALAIVAAVVIMVLPPDNEAKGGKRQLMPTPAPDRMETNPLGKQSQVDPWAQPDDPDYAAPTPPSRRQPSLPPVPDPNDPNDPNDIYGGLTGGSVGGLSSSFMLTMFHKACDKLQSCPGATSTISAVCDQFSSFPKPAMPSNCPSAQKCLDAIDKLDCDAGGQSGNPLTAVYLLQDCTKAATEC